MSKKGPEEASEWDASKEGHAGTRWLSAWAPGTAQTGTDFGEGGPCPCGAHTPQQGLGLQTCQTIFKRAFELHLGVKQPGQGESTACENNVLPTDGKK